MNNTMLGHYRILEKIDEGQLGATWLAEDIRLERRVAVKILSDRICEDRDWLTRVRDSVKTAALLNHPNIAQIYSIEDHSESGTDGGKPLSYVTMEYVTGRSLNEVIGNKPVPLEQAVTWATALADALTHAHTRGCRHGALYPSGIIIREDLQPRILEFGMTSIPRPQGDPLESDSISVSSVAHLVIRADMMPYMAPEQKEGLQDDPRSDVYSLGVILYQMLTGRLPDVNMDADLHPKAVNPKIDNEVDRIIRKCLQPDLGRRYQQMIEVRNDLETFRLEGEGIQDQQPPPAVRHRILIWALSAVSAGLIIGFLAALAIMKKTPRPLQFQIPISATAGRFTGGVISPDGSGIVYMDRGRLYLRNFQDISTRELPGTVGARDPFWSPDQSYIGYIRNENPPILVKHRLDDENTVTIATLPDDDIAGIAWQDNDQIILSAADITNRYDLFTVSAQSGNLTPVNGAKPTAHRLYPSLIPGSETRLYNLEQMDGKRVDLIAEKPDGTNVLLLSNEEGLRYKTVVAPTGHLIYEYDNSLWYRAFDPDNLTVGDRPELIAPSGRSPSVSLDGTLLYTAVDPPMKQMVRIGRSGNILGTSGTTQENILDVATPMNQNQIAVRYIENGNHQIGIHFDDGRLSPLTFDLSEDRYPAWSPDGDEIVYVEKNNGRDDLFRKRIDGTREAIRLTEDTESISWPAWSPDGNEILYQKRDGDQYDLWRVAVSGNRPPTPFIQSPYNEHTPVFSPDGKYIAFVSDSTGTNEIYIAPIANPVTSLRVSDNGGIFPTWADDELFYVQDNVLMVTDLSTQREITASIPRKILSGEQLSTILADKETRRYGIRNQGSEIVVVRPSADRMNNTIIISLHWSSLVRP